MIRAPLPHGLPPAGKFVLEGDRQSAHPGPQLVESANGHSNAVPAHIMGKIAGKRLLLSIMSPGIKKANYILVHGGGPGPFRCL